MKKSIKINFNDNKKYNLENATEALSDSPQVPFVGYKEEVPMEPTEDTVLLEVDNEEKPLCDERCTEPCGCGAKTSMEDYYDIVNHPEYYNTYDMETIDMLRAIFGDEKVSIWCELTAMKYRLRMGLKPGNDVNQDLAKEKWYLKKYRELKED